MGKRVVAAGMWLFVITWMWNYAAWLFGMPTELGPLMGLVVAALATGLPRELWNARRGMATIDASTYPTFVGPLGP
jgi:hypothetical protein